MASKLLAPLTRSLHAVPGADPEFSRLPVQLDRQGIAADWKKYQPDLIATEFSEQGLVLKCLTESVWFQNLRGPMLYRHVSGDGVVTLSVKTRKSSDTTSFPDTQWQFGGIMFRDPASDALLSRESYVFNVVGHRHDALQIETKSTHNGYSNVSAVNWESGDARLQIERRGSVFTLRAKPFGDDDWREMCEYDRPDFPLTLQLAIIVYAYSEGQGIVDMQAEFSDFSFTPL